MILSFKKQFMTSWVDNSYHWSNTIFILLRNYHQLLNNYNQHTFLFRYVFNLGSTLRFLFIGSSVHSFSNIIILYYCHISSKIYFKRVMFSQQQWHYVSPFLVYRVCIYIVYYGDCWNAFIIYIRLFITLNCSFIVG